MQRIDRTLRRLANQDTALTNAARATATLRKRRHEQEDVDAYLQARDRTSLYAAQNAGSIGSPIAAHRTSPIEEAL